MMPGGVPINIVEFKNHRLRLRMTQATLSEALGVSKGTVSSIEIGRRVPSEALFDKIVEVFGAGSEEVLQVPAGQSPPPVARPIKRVRESAPEPVQEPGPKARPVVRRGTKRFG